MDSIEVRRVRPGELDAMLAFRTTTGVPLIGRERYLRELDEGMYRTDWSWVATSGRDIVGRALWWGPSGASSPSALDCLFVDDALDRPAPIAASLLDAGHAAFRANDPLGALPEYHLELPNGWRGDPSSATAVAWRLRAAARAGLGATIERRRFEWVDGWPLPERRARLRFLPAGDGAFLAAFRRVAEGSLDLHTLREVAARGPAAQAADDLAFYSSLPGRRDGWRLAFDRGDAVIGLIIPSRSAYDASVSYLGVVPEARGHGYVDDLLAEITHVHAGAGSPRITGTTDATNRPMLAAFDRAGYRATSTRIVLSESRA